MNMKIQTVIMMFLGVLVLSASGCGSNTVDPIQMMDPSFPALNTIQNGNISNTITAPGFNSNTPYWTFNNLGGLYGGSYVAPAAGIVSEIGLTTVTGVQTSYLVILHSGRLATKISGLQVPTVQVGSSVVPGQIIASFVTSGPTTFQVLVDGSPVCPLSYMSTGFRQTFTTFGFAPCQ